MNGKSFLDTNVLVYAYLKDDPRSHAAESLVISGAIFGVQQLNEFVSVARHKLRRPWEEVRTAVGDLRLLCADIRPLTLETHQAALEIAERYGYRIYDSLVIAAALEASCAVLYSEDMQDHQRIDSLTIRNPFTA